MENDATMSRKRRRGGDGGDGASSSASLGDEQLLVDEATACTVSATIHTVPSSDVTSTNTSDMWRSSLRQLFRREGGEWFTWLLSLVRRRCHDDGVVERRLVNARLETALRRLCRLTAL